MFPILLNSGRKHMADSKQLCNKLMSLPAPFLATYNLQEVNKIKCTQGYLEIHRAVAVASRLHIIPRLSANNKLRRKRTQPTGYITIHAVLEINPPRS
jgi:hypothetical protein